MRRPLNDDTGARGSAGDGEPRPGFSGPGRIWRSWKFSPGRRRWHCGNAQMYKEGAVFISVLEPVLVRKRKFMAMQKAKSAP